MSRDVTPSAASHTGASEVGASESGASQTGASAYDASGRGEDDDLLAFPVGDAPCAGSFVTPNRLNHSILGYETVMTKRSGAAKARNLDDRGTGRQVTWWLRRLNGVGPTEVVYRVCDLEALQADFMKDVETWLAGR